MHKPVLAALCAAMCSLALAATPAQCGAETETAEPEPAPGNRREIAPLDQSLQPLASFEGVWNVAESMKAFGGMPEGNAYGRMIMHRALKGQALIGNLFERGDNGQNYMGHLVITPKEQAGGQPGPNNFAVYWADSQGHSSYNTNATWSNNQLVTESDTPKGKMRHTIQKVSNDKLEVTFEVMRDGKWDKVAFATYNRITGPQGSSSSYRRNTRIESQNSVR